METQTRQFKLKLRKPNTEKEEKLEETLNQFQACVNKWIEKIDELDEKPTRGNVHELAYHDIKDEFPNLYSNTLQECMNRAIEIMRSHPRSLPKYQTDSMSFKDVDMKYDSDNIGIPVAGKEYVWLPLIVPSYFGKYRELEKGRAQVIRENGDWYALIAVEYPVKEEIQVEGVLGVDLGIRQIAVVSDSEGTVNDFYGSERLEKRKQLKARQDALMEEKSGGSNACRALQRLSGKRSRFMDDVNHKISKDIVETAKHYRYKIAVENLTGIRHDGGASQTLRGMLNRWAYRDLVDKIEYKAEAAGIPVEYVDPRKTSKTCSKCGTENDIGAAKQYQCSDCSVELNRDLNAARNISERGGSSCA